MGIVEEKDGKQDLIACIETCPEEWSNRLIVTELWVHEKSEGRGSVMRSWRLQRSRRF